MLLRIQEQDLRWSLGGQVEKKLAELKPFWSPGVDQQACVPVRCNESITPLKRLTPFPRFTG